MLADINRKRRVVRAAVMLCMAITCGAWGKVIYVDDDASAPGDGSSWQTAYQCLQDALAEANDSEKPVEIRVAQGIYRPDQGAGLRAGDRNATFRLISGVTLRGGYAGLGQPDPNLRDIRAYKTILSGDLRGDDREVDDLADLLNTNMGNSRTVVTGSSTDSTAVLDGFTVTRGYFTISHLLPEPGAAGMYNLTGSPTVIRCTFMHNASTGPAAMYNEHGSSPMLIDCIFAANLAIGGSAGVTNRDSSPRLVRCIFNGNGSRSGAAMYNRDSSPVSAQAYNCIFWGSDGLIDDARAEPPMNVRYSNIQYGWPGEGNMSTDPCFVGLGRWVCPDDPSRPASPGDPNAIWVDGDYHLKSQAGRWDPISEDWIRDGATSLCIDAGDPNSPVGDEPQPNGGRINMGAYGGTGEASKSYFGEPVCETLMAGDINGDCRIDCLDLELMAIHWLWDGTREQE